MKTTPDQRADLRATKHRASMPVWAVHDLLDDIDELLAERDRLKRDDAAKRRRPSVDEDAALVKARDVYDRYVDNWLKAGGTTRAGELVRDIAGAIREERQRADESEATANKALSCMRMAEQSAEAWKDLAEKYERMQKNGFYRCFHCGNVFAAGVEAENHFGPRCDASPTVCLQKRGEAAEQRAAALEAQLDDLLRDVIREADAEMKAAALEAALREHVEAAECIRHWHDTGQNNEGMIVSAEKVRELWDATKRASKVLRDHGGALAAHDAEVRRKALIEAAQECDLAAQGFTTLGLHNLATDFYERGVWLRDIAERTVEKESAS